MRILNNKKMVVSRTSTTAIVAPLAVVPEALEGTIINELNEALAA